MPRKREIVRRAAVSDPRHKSPLVARFTHCLMRKGKKSLAQSILYDAFNVIKKNDVIADLLEVLNDKPFQNSLIYL